MVVGSDLGLSDSVGQRRFPTGTECEAVANLVSSEICEFEPLRMPENSHSLAAKNGQQRLSMDMPHFAFLRSSLRTKRQGFLLKTRRNLTFVFKPWHGEVLP